MDPSPKRFPVLSYVMSQIGPKSNAAATVSSDDDDGSNSNSIPSIDIEEEQPHPHPHPLQTSGDDDDDDDDGSNSNSNSEGNLINQMPHLNHPEVLASMTKAISDVSQTRSILQTLGERPDHQTLDTARTKIFEIECDLHNYK